MQLKKNEIRKQRLIEAAKKLFSEKGFYSTYVDEIIKEAGVGKGTFYRNFKNKEDIFVSLLFMFLNDWQSSVSIGIDKNISTSYIDYIKKVALESFIFFKKNEELSNLYFRIAPGLSAIIEPYLKNFEIQMLDYIIKDLEKARDLGYLDKSFNVKLAANIVAGAFFRVHYYYFTLKSDEAASSNIEELVNEFFNMLFFGVLYKNRQPAQS
ncbi:MAG: TetR/AcrR family transcriptional regulator [Spirochaetes bacterium]|nr:TetR/AcrR family transcriptional regulator [Spirochaetota bacterium]